MPQESIRIGKAELSAFVAAIFTYFVQLGPNLPTTGPDWGKALMAAAIAALGVFAKDATVGSKPPSA